MSYFLSCNQSEKTLFLKSSWDWVRSISPLFWLTQSQCISHSVMSDYLWPSWTVAHQASLSMGFFRQEILEWVAISFSTGSSWPKDWTHNSCVSCIASRFFICWVIWEVDILITLITSAISLFPFMQCNMIIAVMSYHIYRGKGSYMGKHHCGSFWNSACGYMRWALLLIWGLEWE